MLSIPIRVWQIMSSRNLGLISAGVAFFGMLALFPALAAVVAIWGLFADPVVVADQMAQAADFLPDQAYAILDAQVQGLVSADPARLGWATALSVAAAVWSARAGMSALVQGINAIYGAENRGGILHQVVSLALTLSFVGVALAALTIGVALPLVLAFAPLGPYEAFFLGVARWSLGPAIIIAGIGIVYRYGPNLHRRRPRLLSVGVGVAMLLWVAAAEGFSIYLTNFGNYNQIYGSIGAVAALLMWLYLSAYAVLLGAAVNAAIIETADQ